MRFRTEAGYDTTVETTIYCAPEAVGKGIGNRLYAALFEALRGEDIHRYVAGYALPNPATAALHERFGFKVVGVFPGEWAEGWEVLGCVLDGAGVIVLLMGVSGAGKTTVGTMLAAQLGWEFADGDDYHPAANVEKMRNGIPLTDADREPWLETLRALIAGWIAAGKNVVLACSALKRVYRDRLMVGESVRVVYLKADRELLRERLLLRRGHYMKEGMLESQIETLEEPANAIVLDARSSVEDIVREVRVRVTESL